MKIIDRWYLTLTHLLPRRIRDQFEQMSIWANLGDRWYKVVGIPVSIALVIMISGLLIAWLGQLELTLRFVALGIGLGAIPLGLIISYVLLYFVVDRRANAIEEVLPDALQVIASNLRSGSTPYESCTRVSPEAFGPLGEEFAKALRTTTGKKSFAENIMKIPKNVKSNALQRSIRIFANSIKSGGHLADLLDNLAIDITERRALKKDLVINTATNSMFIMFTIVVGTPTLLSISIFFVDVVSALQADSSDSAASFGGFGGELEITSSFLIQVSYGLLLVTSLLACLFMGAMIDGEATKGLKYAPFVIGATFVMFFVARFLINFFLGSQL